MVEQKQLPINQIVCGDSFQVLKDFPSESIDMIQFSPPYWGLRDYGKVEQVFGDGHCEHEWTSKKIKFHGGTSAGKKQLTNRGSFHNDFMSKSGFCVKCGAWKGQFGLEPHPSIWIQHMVELCRLLKRVLKKSGSLYLNVGDTYYGGGGHQDKSMSHGKMIIGSFLSASRAKNSIPNKPLSNWLQPKQLLLMPSRLAIALQDDGWLLRNDICWRKPNHMPSSVKDRLTNSWEHIFHFVKARRYFYDLDSIRKPHKQSTKERSKYGRNPIPPKAWATKGAMPREPQQVNLRENPLGKNPSDAITTYEGKFEGFGEESEKFGSPRARTQRKQPYAIQPKTKEFVECRNLPPLEEVKKYLNYWRKKRGLTIDEVEAKLESQAPHHWFNAESYPTKEDWLRIKQLFDFDDKYDSEMLQAFNKPSAKQDFPLGKNPSDFWSINTKPFKGAHFAVYPEKICEAPIKSSCPLQICVACGKPRKRIVERSIPKIGKDVPRKKASPKGKLYQDEVEVSSNSALRTSGGDRWVRWKLNHPDKFVGFSDCGCGKGFEAGIVLDPMCGSGTTCVVAHKLGRRWIGIELNPDYVEIANKRLESVGAFSSRLEDFKVKT